MQPKIGFIGQTTRQDIIKDLNFAAKNHFEYYEVGPHDTNFKLKPNIIKQARKIAKKHDISLNFHIPYFLPISSLIPGVSKTVLEFAKQEITLANQLGAKIITLHSGDKEIFCVKAAIRKNFEIFVKNLKEIVGFGKKYGIKIGLENSFHSQRICRTPKEILKITNLINGLGITFDGGHANVLGINPATYFKKIKNKVINVHIADNYGKTDEHSPIGKGNINFKQLLKEFKNANYYGPFILEVFPPKNVLRTRDTFLKIWNQ